MHRKAEKHLASVDPVMAGLIAKVGACRLKPEPWRSPFHAEAGLELRKICTPARRAAGAAAPSNENKT